MTLEPERLVVECKGENGPQSPAGLYSLDTGDPLALDRFELVEGNPMSYNNYCDLDRALGTMSAMARVFEYPSHHHLVIGTGVKHGNPCGASYRFGGVHILVDQVVIGDPLSLFGGGVMVNCEIDDEAAESLIRLKAGDKKRVLAFVAATSFTEGARNTLKRTDGDCRLLVNQALGTDALATSVDGKRRRQVRGGFLVQGEYNFVLDWNHTELERHGDLTSMMRDDLSLAWAVGSRSNSNTITLVKNGMLIGNGVGQQSRVDAAKLAVGLATDRGHDVRDAVAYSDSFFPFADGPQFLIDQGIKAVFATRGSKRDAEVIDTFVKAGVVFVTMPDSIARGFFGH